MKQEHLNYRNDEAHASIRQALRRITALVDLAPYWPEIASIAQRVPGHKREVQSMEHSESVAQTLALVAQIMEQVGDKALAAAGKKVSKALDDLVLATMEADEAVAALDAASVPENTPEVPEDTPPLPVEGMGPVGAVDITPEATSDVEAIAAPESGPAVLGSV